MTALPLAVIGAVVLCLAAGCRGQRRCNDRTVLLTVTLVGGAQEAEEIEVRPSVEGRALTGGPVARRPGDVSGTVEVVLGDRYQADALVTIVVVARAKGVVLAEGQVVEWLTARCSTLSVLLGAGPSVPPLDGAGSADAGAAPSDGPEHARNEPADAPLPADGPTPPDAPEDVAPDLPPDGAPDTLPAPRRIFVTRDRYTGNMGGLAGAHGLCTQLANAAGLTGSFKAWLSTATSGPAAFMAQHPVPYVLPSGQAVATGWGDLVDGSLSRPIDRDQNGDLADPQGICEGGEVWTNTTAAGTPIGPSDCAGWTSLALDPALASAAGNLRYSDTRWTSSGCRSIGCNFALQIYCIEQ